MLTELTLVFGLLCVVFSVTRSLVASIEERPLWPTLALGGVGLLLLAIAWHTDPDGLRIGDVPIAVVKLFRLLSD
ncbi:MAG: hypothetical protein AAGI09_14300 [Pseudomonadota bacterium]